ncbi:MAG: polymorphic toxin-type HINT domain-containing protein [Verrucomicrobiota bacterium]
MKYKQIVCLKKAIRSHWLFMVAATTALLGLISILTAAEPSAQSQYPNLSDANQLVQVCDGKPEWIIKPLGEVADNKEFIAGGYLCRMREGGMMELVSEVDIERLADADKSFEKDNWRFPEAPDVVRVLDDQGKHVWHEQLDHVHPGSQFVFQGRRFKAESGDTPGAVDIVDTGQTLSQVVQTFKRKTDTLLDLTIRNETGSNSLISCTPEHPFYVPARSAYIAALDLKPDTVFQTANQKLATLASVAVRHGDFEVFNFEVESAHNYFVGKDQILVHNACKILPGKYSDSEMRAAAFLGKDHDVILRPPTGTRAGGGTSDLLVDGKRYDVYTPETSNPDRIFGAIADKKDQAEGIIVDLSKTSVRPEQMGDVLARLRGKGIDTIKDVIFFGNK